MTDLATFGETMVRLTPPDEMPIEQADAFQVHVGGAESNVAIAAQRLGLETVWLSKLPDNPAGRRVVTALQSHGVRPAVTWDGDGRLGLYYYEPGTAPRQDVVVYDRSHSSICSASIDELAVEYVEEATAFHSTGITTVLSATTRETVTGLYDHASAAGTETWFDLNYRSTLGSPEEARARFEALAPTIDGLVVAMRDVEPVLERSGPPESVARTLAEEYGFETVIVTVGADGAVGVHDGTVIEQPAVPAERTHPIGSGDAFVGGFLASWLGERAFGPALEVGVATAALKLAFPGDSVAVTPEAVDRLVDGDVSDRLSR